MAYAAVLRRGAADRLGAAARSICSGSSRTTPSTRWSTATTTCKLGIRTSAMTFGRYDVLVVMLCYAIYLAGMTCGRRAATMGPPITRAVVALACASITAADPHRERAGCFRAFLHNHWLGLAVFAGIALDYAALRAALRTPRGEAPKRAPRAAEPLHAARRGLPPVLARHARADPRQLSRRGIARRAVSTTRIRAIISGRSSPRCSTCRSRSYPTARDCARCARTASGCGTRSWPAGATGSLDAAIRNRRARRDRTRASRGAGARARLLQRQDRGPGAPAWREAGYATLVLPSSSPAYTLPFAEKLAAWRSVGEFLRRRS